LIFACSFPDSGPSYDILNLAELRIVSRKVLPVMHFKFHLYEDFLLLFLLLLLLRLLIRHGKCFIFYACSLDVQFSHQHFEDRPNLEMFGFSFFTIFIKPIIVQPVYIVSSSSGPFL